MGEPARETHNDGCQLTGPLRSDRCGTNHRELNPGSNYHTRY